MISAMNLCKSFKLYRKPADRLLAGFLGQEHYAEFEALKDLSLEVAPGDVVGIIGRNGAGKSTLLKLLNGVLIPDSGRVMRRGRVTGLLELGTGFDLQMSGRQNILTNGLLLGMSKKEVYARQDAIIHFSGLGAHIDDPLRTYSSGMVVRLAFAIAIHAQPQTFLIDEALSVGDAHFQQKCMRKIREFRSDGGAIVFVSHDLNAVKMLCDEVVVLDHGRVVKRGTPEEAVNHYYQLLAGDFQPETEPETVDGGGYGSLAVRFTHAAVKGALSANSTMVPGEDMVVEVGVSASIDTDDLCLGMGVRDGKGQNFFGTNSHHLGMNLAMSAGDVHYFQFKMPMLLASGEYSISLALHEGVDHTKHCYHWWDRACRFTVAHSRDADFQGICDLRAKVAVSIADASG